jgi:hypothetical protein
MTDFGELHISMFVAFGIDEGQKNRNWSSGCGQITTTNNSH